MKYLAIDYGSKKVGIATSDDDGRMAYPCMVLPNDKKLMEEIKGLCRELKISEIVIGDSVNSDGKPNEIMKAARAFAVTLEDAIDLPIHFEKEWMSSMHARAMHDGKEVVDDSAAALILQRYLDKVNKVYKDEAGESEDDGDETAFEE